MTEARIVHLFFIAVFLLAGCADRNAPDKLFEQVDNSGIVFVNQVEDGPRDNSFLFRNFYNGGGVAIGDINNDGLAEVFLTSNTAANKLFLNKGNFTFEDITERSLMRYDSLWSTGATFVDINSDGWLDLYVCSSGHMSTGRRRNRLYINNRDLSFTEAARSYGLDLVGYSTHASFFDYDADGDLDMFLINNSPIPVNQLGYANRRDLPEAQWAVGEFLKGGGDHLFRNDNGMYVEVTKEAGIHGSLISFGLGVTVGDINADGYPDIYVANDSYERDYLYINRHDGTFSDEFENYFAHTSMSSMGADLADINNDGYQDIFTTDMLPENDFRLKTLGAFDNIDLYRSKERAGFYHQFMQNCLQVNNQGRGFLETAFYSGVAATDWSWGALLFDADNDGLNDIFVCNGINRDVTNLDFMDFFANDVMQQMILSGKKEGVEKIAKEIPVQPMANKAFRNLGNLKFADAGVDWGFEAETFSNGAAYADLDNDGDLDLVINNENQPALVYRNTARQSRGHHFIGVSLKGKAANTFAIGATCRIYAGDEMILRELIPSRGFQSSVDYKLIAGLGNRTLVDSMSITWPDRSVTTIIKPAVDQVHSVVQPANPQRPVSLVANPVATPPFFAAVPLAFDKHQEDDYVDFYYERNIPHLLSREGPKAATGDVNGDGLADIFIGGASGQAGHLYLQLPNGGFVKKPQPSFDLFRAFEDAAVLFFDADQDGDLDLFVGPGGNHVPPGTREIQLRLFRNDGRGNFTISTEAFPPNDANIGVAAAADFDRDGDLDLFVGARSQPRDYGLTPRSFLFQNDGKGNFTDVAARFHKDLAAPGMITDATWADVTGDDVAELILVGQWMPPRIFSFKGGSCRELSTDLAAREGWWNALAVADLDADGRQDLILGNAGENFYLRPEPGKPVKLWINDFNGNGTTDKILTRYVDDADRTVFLKHELQDQIPAVKKQNLKHGAYATKKMSDLFPSAMLQSSTVKTWNYASSCVAFNRGNGKFDVRPLPPVVQLSSVHAILCTDVNGDKFPDLILGGNNFGFLPQFGRLDASLGHVLLNNGGGEFTRANGAGIEVKGEIRDVEAVNTRSGRLLLFLRNNDTPIAYRAGDGDPAAGTARKGAAK